MMMAISTTLAVMTRRTGCEFQASVAQGIATVVRSAFADAVGTFLIRDRKEMSEPMDMPQQLAVKSIIQILLLTRVGDPFRMWCSCG
jgi:hypothetical protein